MKVMVSQGLLANMMQTAAVATATPIATGNRAVGPSAISAPTATPVAGQKMDAPT